jgi:hypothetical protein
MTTINFRDAAAWPMTADDRATLIKLRQKQRDGEDLSSQETQRMEAILRAAHRDEHGQRGLRRDRTVDELLAELDKRN